MFINKDFPVLAELLSTWWSRGCGCSALLAKGV